MRENIRLIVWDLDDTFWRGTLSEEGIQEFYQDHNNIIGVLARRGIMSSIASRNDFDAVKNVLTAQGVWDYFIFPSIGWSSKGPRIAQLIEDAQLRPATVLFIDDNPNNLAEARAFVPEIQVAEPTIIPSLLDSPLCVGKDDSDLTRLAQYKVLEKRKADQNAATKAGENVAFLRSCNIRIEIEHDVTKHVDRAIELINRTNNLNFTKIRLDERTAREDFLKLVSEFNVQAGLIHVRDDYGDYGLAGLYVTKGPDHARWLEHFCFSCRILGMGVESWIYDKLGRPSLQLRGDVLSDPRSGSVDWINGGAGVRAGGPKLALEGFDEVRLAGGCNLDAIAHYFRLGSAKVISQTNRGRNGLFLRHDFLPTIVQKSSPAIAEVLMRIGYEARDLEGLFSGEMPRSLHIVSTFADFSAPFYRHRASGTMAALLMDPLPTDLTAVTDEQLSEFLARRDLKANEQFLRDVISELRDNWDYVRVGPIEERAQLVKDSMGSFLSIMPADARCIFIMPNTRGVDNGQFIKLPTNTEYVGWVTEMVQGRDNVKLILSDECIESPMELKDYWGSHFDRGVYLRMAEKIANAWR
jgi:FkbH-like protein